jgi:hypothetical protein
MTFWSAWSRPAPLIDPAPDVEAELAAKFTGPLDRFPVDRTDVYRIFGNPGTGKVDPKWFKANIVEFQGKRAIPGIPPRWYFQCHRLAEPYVREGFRRFRLTGSDYVVERVGGFNFRHQRNDPSRPLSYHSWGIAIDINSSANAGWYVKSPPEPWSDEWTAHYPRGVPKELVRAFESVGWKWGGRWSGYCDPQHFELVR